MKPGTLQFDVRENAASQRRQASQQIARPVTDLAPSTPTRGHQLSDHENWQGNHVERSSVSASDRAAAHTVSEQASLLTVAEVAHLLQVPVSWVYGRMRRRSPERLPAYKLGKYWRFRESEIAAWLTDQSPNVSHGK